MPIALLLMLAAGPSTAQITPAIANPASVYCVQRGGRVEIVDTKKGQIGICVLPDGRRVEEWEFFRARRAQAPRGG